MNLGENIYRLRTRKNMSQGDLADALEVSRQSVSKWENNSAVPELEKIVKMSELFGVTLDELVNGPNNDAVPVSANKPAVPPRTILGIASLCLGLLFFLVFGSLYWILELSVNIEVAILFSVLFAVCGIICLLQKSTQLYRFQLALYFSLWVMLTFFVRSFGPIPLFLRIILAVCGVLLLVHRSSRSNLNRHPSWLKCLLIALLGISLILSLITIAGSIIMIS